MSVGREMRWFTAEPNRRQDAIVLLLHGGTPHSMRPVGATSSSWLRMWEFARDISTRVSANGSDSIGVALLRNKVRGWNSGIAPAAEPDARWALDQLAELTGGAPVILVGHSMGGRSALAVADHPTVRGVVAMAPWLPDAEPMRLSTDQTLTVVQGLSDSWCPPQQSLAFCERAVAGAVSTMRAEVPGVGHFMLRKRGEWRDFVTLSTIAALQQVSPDQVFAEARRPLQIPVSDAIKSWRSALDAAHDR
ncbi:MAG: alpha/beta fold hydrolase [Antricoccus sp.]